MSQCKITLLPEGKTVEVSSEDSLLKALADQGVQLKSSCGGVASCGECKVKVMSGESNLTPPTFGEIKLLGNVFHITKERLSCQAKACGDAALDIQAHDPEVLRVQEEQKRAKQAELRKQKTVLRKQGTKRPEPPKQQESRYLKKESGHKRPKAFRLTEGED